MGVGMVIEGNGDGGGNCDGGWNGDGVENGDRSGNGDRGGMVVGWRWRQGDSGGGGLVVT